MLRVDLFDSNRARSLKLNLLMAVLVHSPGACPFKIQIKVAQNQSCSKKIHPIVLFALYCVA